MLLFSSAICRRIRVFIAVCVVAYTSAPLFAQSVIGRKISEFVSEDQFESRHSVRFRTKPTLVLIGDRKGIEIMSEWERRIDKDFAGKIDVVRIAYFKGMPFFVPRGLARNAVKKTYPAQSVLCDWDGEISSSFYYDEGCRVFVLDSGGIVRAFASGYCTDDAYRVPAEKIRFLLP